MFNSQKGFTLIQLIVVMAVLAVLVGLAVPSYLDHVEQAQETRIEHDARLVQDAVDRYISTDGNAEAFQNEEYRIELDDEDWDNHEEVFLYTYLDEEDIDEDFKENAEVYNLNWSPIEDELRLNTDQSKFVAVFNSPAEISVADPSYEIDSETGETLGEKYLSEPVSYEPEDAEDDFPRDDIDIDMEQKSTYTGHSIAVRSVHLGSDGYLYSGSLDDEVHKIE